MKKINKIDKPLAILTKKIKTDEHFNLQNTFLPIPIEMSVSDFPGGTVVKNPPANAGDKGSKVQGFKGSSPGPGRSHMPRSN